MLIKLSHNLSEHTPFYSSLPKPQLTQIYDLAKGDTCNSFYLSTSNHAGTHVDAPRHFHPEGRAITDYQLSELVFLHAVVVDLAVQDEELILPRHLRTPLADVPSYVDMLLLRSGFAQHRHDERRYIDRGPGFGQDAADLLMSRFEGLRAIAMDFPSVSALTHERDGAEAHRVFLGCTKYSDRPVLLVEDALLPAELPALQRVFVIPWLFDGLDSAPCTMFAEVAHHA